MPTTPLTRREFFKSSFLSLLAIVFWQRTASAKGKAGVPDGKTVIAESSPMAQALGYKEYGKSVDKKKFPQFKPEQKCQNCQLYSKLNGSWGSCNVLDGGVVAANGWCASWVLNK